MSVSVTSNEEHEAAYFHSPDKTRVRIVHHDILRSKLFQHLIVVVVLVRPHDDELLGRQDAKVLVEVEGVEVVGDRVLGRRTKEGLRSGRGGVSRGLGELRERGDGRDIFGVFT